MTSIIKQNFISSNNIKKIVFLYRNKFLVALRKLLAEDKGEIIEEERLSDKTFTQAKKYTLTIEK